VAGGETVILGKAGTPMVVLRSDARPRKRREPESVKGRIGMDADFDAAEAIV
jgi:antitoxin (DNA-binding transcriptional repressor) of toxin-antitoxin stability system